MNIQKIITRSVLGLIAIVLFFSSFYIIQPGERGLKITLGNLQPIILGEGIGMKWPFITRIEHRTIRQHTVPLKTECYSSDLQQVTIDMWVLYSIPENAILQTFRDYQGSMFETVVAPRLQEAIKEVVATNSAEQVVKKREEIKVRTLESLLSRVGPIVTIVDVTIANVDLSDQLEHAIEAKMVQEQEASKAKFTQQKAQIDADTVIIKAKADAESIKIQGEALAKTPNLVQLKIVEKWDGKAPQTVVGDLHGASLVLPLKN